MLWTPGGDGWSLDCSLVVPGSSSRWIRCDGPGELKVGGHTELGPVGLVEMGLCRRSGLLVIQPVGIVLYIDPISWCNRLQVIWNLCFPFLSGTFRLLKHYLPFQFPLRGEPSRSPLN